MKASTKRMIKKVKSLNYKKMDKIVDIISQESHKSKFYIKLDMFINFWTTGCGYTDYFRGNCNRKRERNHSPSFTISPSSVADVAESTFTFTKSPICAPPRLNTTTLFCSVRPNNCSRLRLLTPSTSTSNTEPTHFSFASSERRFCRAISSLRRRTFTSSGTSSSKWRAAYVPGRSLYLNMKAES